MENYTGQSSAPYSGPQQPLPNATASLVLGILSILGCCGYAVPGLALGIIAVVLASKDERLYRTNPGMYTASSYNNTKAGKVCGIVSIVISALYMAILIFMVVLFGFAIFTDPHSLHEALYNMQH